MPRPNIIIAGTQKSGTTWLHRALSKSEHIFGSEQKELNFFNKRDFADNFDELESHFQNDAARNVKYRLESTPHYFQLPFDEFDIAKNIRDNLDNPKIIVLLRNPVDRYESAYIHHMMQGRFEYKPFINSFTDEHKMLTLGRYTEILRHWQSVFPDLIVQPYYRVKEDKVGLITDVFAELNVEMKLDAEELEFKTNAKEKKVDQLNTGWDRMPKLTRGLRNKLVDYYDPIVRGLADLVDWDVKPLLTQKVEIN